MNNHTVTLHGYTLAITGTSSCLSILGAIVIFVTYYRFPNIRNFTRKLLICLTVADLMTATGNLVATIRYAVVHVHDLDAVTTENCHSYNASVALPVLCDAQSYVTTISNMSSFFWTFIIALHIWSSVIFKSRKTEAYTIYAVYHLICWGIPLVIVTVVLLKGYLGEDYCYGTGVWCGIRSSLDRATIATWMYVADVAWQLACYILTCFLYIYLKFHIKVYHRDEDLRAIANNLRNEDSNFLFVWMIIYLLKLWGLTRFFITTYAPHEELANNDSLRTFLAILLNLQSYGASGQAFWNCVVFCGCDAAVRKSIRQWIFGETDEERMLLNKTKTDTML